MENKIKTGTITGTITEAILFNNKVTIRLDSSNEEIEISNTPDDITSYLTVIHNLTVGRIVRIKSQDKEVSYKDIEFAFQSKDIFDWVTHITNGRLELYYDKYNDKFKLRINSKTYEGVVIIDLDDKDKEVEMRFTQTLIIEKSEDEQKLNNELLN